MEAQLLLLKTIRRKNNFIEGVFFDYSNFSVMTGRCSIQAKGPAERTVKFTFNLVQQKKRFSGPLKQLIQASLEQIRENFPEKNIIHFFNNAGMISKTRHLFQELGFQKKFLEKVLPLRPLNTLEEIDRVMKVDFKEILLDRLLLESKKTQPFTIFNL